MSLDVRDITAGLSCERQQCLLRIVYGVGVKEEEVFFFSTDNEGEPYYKNTSDGKIRFCNRPHNTSLEAYGVMQ